MDNLNVLIVGCGNIASIFDQGRDKKHLPLSHAGAYIKDGRFHIDACVDPDKKRRMNFMKTWGVNKAFSSIEQVLASDLKFDVISICSPSERHVNDLEVAIELRPKFIFCEKPLTLSLNQSFEISSKCQEKNIILGVNFSRRFDEDVIKIKNEIQQKKWGELRTVVGFYNKGLLNNGSHMLDLIIMLIGKLDVLKVGKKVIDYLDNDPSIPIWLEGENGEQIYLVCNLASDYSLFELQFVFESGFVCMGNGGLWWNTRTPVESQIFSGYRSLDDGVFRGGNYLSSMSNSINSIYSAVTFGSKFESTHENAIYVQLLCEKINILAN